MRDINDFMPKIPGMRFGVVTNFWPDNAKLKQIAQTIPHDEKWHTLFESPNEVNIDGVSIRRKTLESMT